MLLSPETLHYLAAVLAIVLSGFGIGLGLATAVSGMMSGMVRQSQAYAELNKTLMYGVFIIEGSFIVSFIVAISILFPAYTRLTMPIALGELGMSLAVGLCSSFVGLASGFAVRGACQAVARQPLFAGKIQLLTITLQTLIETPVFFSFVIAIIIKTQLSESLLMSDGMRIMAAGIATGVGAIGPSIGQLIFSERACFAPGINRQAYVKIFAFCVLTEALIETPVLFSFVVSIFMLFKKIALAPEIALLVFLSIALVISLGTAGTAIGIGLVGSKGVTQVAMEPDSYPQILKTSLICQILIETGSLFAFVTALSMLIKATTF